MRCEELYERRQRRELTDGGGRGDAGVTARTCRRWRDRYEADGAEGLQYLRLECPSGWAMPVDEARRMVTRYETQYTGSAPGDASQETAAQTLARHDAPSRWLLA